MSNFVGIPNHPKEFPAKVNAQKNVTCVTFLTHLNIPGSDRSTVSPAGSWIGKLSYQDRIGYATVRSIRRQYPGEDLTDILHGSISSKSYIVYIKARQFLYVKIVLCLGVFDVGILFCSDQDGDILESSITSGPSLTSLSSIQKFSVKDSVKNTGQCYMGICLPQVLTDLFPRSGFKQAMNFPFRNQPGDGK